METEQPFTDVLEPNDALVDAAGMYREVVPLATPIHERIAHLEERLRAIDLLISLQQEVIDRLYKRVSDLGWEAGRGA